MFFGAGFSHSRGMLGVGDLYGLWGRIVAVEARASGRVVCWRNVEWLAYVVGGAVVVIRYKVYLRNGPVGECAKSGSVWWLKLWNVLVCAHTTTLISERSQTYLNTPI
jgi:hypothetical protein